MKAYTVTISLMPDPTMRANLTRWEIELRVTAGNPLQALAQVRRSEVLKAALEADKRLKRQINNGAGLLVSVGRGQKLF